MEIFTAASLSNDKAIISRRTANRFPTARKVIPEMFAIQPAVNAVQQAKPFEAAAPDALSAPKTLRAGGSTQNALREAFDDFVGQTFYSQMLSAMRKTVDKPAYFHGGQAEEVFQAQLDQTLSERLADATAEQFTGPMFDLFNLPRS